MIEITSLLFLATATIGGVSMTARVVAAGPGHCRKDCKQDVTACLALVPKNADCTGTKAAKRACRRTNAQQRKGCHHLVKLCKQENPGTSGVCVLSSTTSTTMPGTSGCGTFLTAWGTMGSGAGQFNHPVGVATDANGDVYVADRSNYRSQKFDGNGTFLTMWGSRGLSSGQFNGAGVLAADASGHVYATDGSNRVQKFDASGAFVTMWGSGGSGNGQFSGAFGLAADALGNVYVVDHDNDRIQKFDANGTFLTTWGTHGSANGQFSGPCCVATDTSGQVFVADQANYRIQKFDGNGTFLAAWGSNGAGNGSSAMASAPLVWRPMRAETSTSRITPTSASRSSMATAPSSPNGGPPARAMDSWPVPRSWRSTRAGTSTSRTRRTTASRSSPVPSNTVAAADRHRRRNPVEQGCRGLRESRGCGWVPE